MFKTIETVVDENPLSFATSRIVTIHRPALWVRPGLEFAVSAGGHYSRDAHRCQALRENPAYLIFTPYLADIFGRPDLRECPGNSPKGGSSPNQKAIRERSLNTARLLCQQGHLTQAEKCHSVGVLALDPDWAPASANLGVVYMRQKHWKNPRSQCCKKPSNSLLERFLGIKLNIGTRQLPAESISRSYSGAFESVVSSSPSWIQARYLLGLCYFFTDRWTDAAATLEPLWPQESQQLSLLVCA